MSFSMVCNCESCTWRTCTIWATGMGGSSESASTSAGATYSITGADATYSFTGAEVNNSFTGAEVTYSITGAGAQQEQT